MHKDPGSQSKSQETEAEISQVKWSIASTENMAYKEADKKVKRNVRFDRQQYTPAV